MSTTSKLSTCQIICWGLAGLAGLAVLVSATGSVGFLAALLLAVAFAAFVGLVFGRLICTGYTPEDRGIEAKDVEASLRQATGITGYKAPFDEDDDAPAPKPAAAASSPARAAEPTASAATAAPAVKAGTLLDGEEELSTRKGEWRYGEQAAPAAKQDEADVGTRPEALSAPKDGKADDLKAIKGVGPKLEKLCNELGFYHYDQIANWTAAEVAWVDENLKGFKGRVSRDGWVDQAKILAAGGETEFSRRVGEGVVY